MLNGTVTGRVLQRTGEYDDGSKKWVSFTFEQVQWNGTQEVSVISVGYAPAARASLIDKCADKKWKFIGSFNHVWVAQLETGKGMEVMHVNGFRFGWIDLP